MPKANRKPSRLLNGSDHLSVTPYGVHRSTQDSKYHGCPHLAALKTASTSPPCPPHRLSPQTQELMSNYRSCFRYSLYYRNRNHLHINRRNKEFKIMCELDDDEAGGFSAGKKRKRTLGWIDREIQHVEKLPLPLCGTCSTTSSVARLHACLGCVYVGCYREGHIQSHMERTGHGFAMDWLTGTIYCTHCKDYAYDLDFERAMRSEQDRMDMIISRIKEPNAKRLRLMEWNPSQQEVDTIQQKSTLMDCSGLRGFYNLGNTCFMSSILQTMIHNPLLKFYFLSDKHNRGLCPKRNHNCMACQLDTVFHEFYSGQTKPYGPASFLHAMWMSQKHMAGYSQQDAHEFFISLANEIHNNCAAERDMLHVRGCKCIVHQTFAGLLQSDVTCSSCQNVSTAHDPMLDLSLEVKRRPKSGKHKPNTADKKAPSGVNGTTEDPATVPKAEAIKDTGLKKVAKGKIKESLDVCTLGDCLDGFTVPEKLEYTCSSCHECKEATKQMSVKKLPPVLSIQLKRFEHSAKSSSSSKIDAIVKVPAELDMTPYTTRAIKLRNKLRGSSAGRKGSKIGAITESPMDGIPSYKYSLFAVVSHTGKLETGHYTTYAKVREQWFAFDDHNVTLADQKEVLEGNGYMCFYLRNGHQYSYSARGGSAANGDVVDLTTSPSKGDNRPNGI